ncbi:Qat anti-phage system QueC-like protein QatC [Aliarcobacter butzleri]|uniref:Qat anti-phage system QueC-like protein QatC n=1 Tax=Aliarcobacter butzleri TaxID=28197 RepID=UPI00215AB87B|nr:Qat anti-phage system QueC-like protein QatC [Aliarcobacter butzleri]MCR8710999.1 7-cyano-7-deazaguanine synthase [Aliarcobacter butzleri]
MNELIIEYGENKERDRNGLLQMYIRKLEDNQVIKVNFNYLNLFKEEQLFNPTRESLDFLYTTFYIYLTDILLPREKTSVDNWSRDIKLNIPVSNPFLWNTNKEILIKALDFLTGDTWELEFFQLDTNYFQVDSLDFNTFDVGHICLLSGGLDSLIGAIDLIKKENNILFISHFGGKSARQEYQRRIFDSLKSKNQNIYLSQFHVEPNDAFYKEYNAQSQKSKNKYDINQRARSILFLGFQVFYAINLNIPQIKVPENGLISINIPLNDSRSTANSTKTTHPYFFEKLEEFMLSLGHQIKINNPYKFCTKGQMLDNCEDKKLMEILLEDTISCSHNAHDTWWIRRGKLNCGYCIPCMIRRASIHNYSPSLDDYSSYGHNLDENELDLDRRDLDKDTDLLAMINFLNKKLSKEELERELLLISKVDNSERIATMLKQGYDEIRKFILEKADDRIKGMIT